MVVIQDDAQLLATIRYVARNPTRAGLVATPGEWAWSSYPGITTGASTVRWPHPEERSSISSTPSRTGPASCS